MSTHYQNAEFFDVVARPSIHNFLYDSPLTLVQMDRFIVILLYVGHVTTLCVFVIEGILLSRQESYISSLLIRTPSNEEASIKHQTATK